MEAEHEKVTKFYFCPKCRKRIMPPSFISKMNIQGSININCGDQKCKGVLKIKPKK